jgi:putative DNA primase/helicase
MAYNPNNTADSSTGQAKPPKPSALRVIPDAIPPDLKALPQWVVWRYYWQKDKWDKPLLQSHSGNLASHSSEKTWSAYQAALDAYRFHEAHLDGIGFVFKKANGFVGIDLDDCRNPQTGAIEPWAQAIIDRFNTYTEISPSATGLHLICKGTLPGHGLKTLTVEMYDTTRYFCITGNVLPGTPATIESPPQEMITTLYQGLRQTQAGGKPRAKPPTNGAGPNPILDDDLIIQKALGAKNAEKFAWLWAGDLERWAADRLAHAANGAVIRHQP